MKTGVPCTFALIIPAAGSGTRMGAERPKPFLEIAGKTILEHTVSRFLPFSGLKRVVIATSGPWVGFTSDLFKGSEVEDILTVVEGGQERRDSVGLALEKTDAGHDLIAVHDAVRPLVTETEISDSLEMARKHGAALPGIECRDTLKLVGKNGIVEKTPDRSRFRLALTPQVFRRELLVRAFEQSRRQSVSDDASMVENLGEPVMIVKGSETNIKITWPSDLILAEKLMNEHGLLPGRKEIGKQIEE
ncbi:MAG: 2-C-methyl-D-erythritol 4-phosphate cytidylyltransferase [Balneolaceae bacterium]